MARDKHTVNTARTTLFRVADASGTAVTGLVNADFGKQAYKDAATNALTITVTEIANGFYKAVYTPDANAYWLAHVSHATYNVAGWQDEIDVVTDPLALSSAERNSIADALLDRADAIVTGITPRKQMVAAYLADAAPSSGMTATGGTAVFTAGGKTLQADLDANGNRSNVSNTL